MKMFGGIFMTVGYLAAAFEVVTVRDLDLIQQARQRCTRLVVGVLRDEEIVRQYGRRPVTPLLERIAVVRHLRGVDEVVVHDGRSVTKLHEVRFAEPGGLSGSSRDAMVLSPRRQTSSRVLGRALRHALDRDVA